MTPVKASMICRTRHTRATSSVSTIPSVLDFIFLSADGQDPSMPRSFAEKHWSGVSPLAHCGLDVRSPLTGRDDNPLGRYQVPLGDHVSRPLL
jgi:hypothetical protein